MFWGLNFQNMIAKNKIAELREAKGWTQQQLAEKSGISRIALSRYENNSPPSKRNLQKLIKALQVPEDFFIPEVVSKKASEKPVHVENLKKRLNSVYNFSPADQLRVLAVIDVIAEKMNLHDRLERIKQL